MNIIMKNTLKAIGLGVCVGMLDKKLKSKKEDDNKTKNDDMIKIWIGTGQRPNKK